MHCMGCMTISMRHVTSDWVTFDNFQQLCLMETAMAPLICINDRDGNRDGSVTADAAPNADETREGQGSSDGPRGITSAVAGNSGRTISGDSRIS